MSPRHKPYEDVDASVIDALWQSLHFDFSGRTARNRLLKAAMSERLSSWVSDPSKAHERGIPSQEMVHLYRVWAQGNLGVLVTGNVLIDYTNLEAASNPIIARDSIYEGLRFERFRQLAVEGKRGGSLVIGQVNHAGRQTPATIEPMPISASDIQLGTGTRYAKPRAATLEEIDDVVEGFVHAAEYLEKAGFDGVQLHAAHGYLLAQFLSARTNHRLDEYGGSIRNRLRLIARIAREIRRRCSSNFILGIKINSVEFQGEGLTFEEGKQLCQTLEWLQFDFVEFSGGTYESGWFDGKRLASEDDTAESTRHREAYFVEFAKMLSPHFRKTKTFLTGGFKTSAAMLQSLQTVDAVGIARPLCLEPHLARELFTGRVNGALRQRIKETDFAFSSCVAGAQMSQLGRGTQPIDLSDEENERCFRGHLREWGKGDRIGWPKLA